MRHPDETVPLGARLTRGKVGNEYVAMGSVRVYVDGIAPGTATITATTNEAFTASCVVTVA